MNAEAKLKIHRITAFGAVGAAVAVLSFVQLWLYIHILGIPSGPAYLIQTFVSVELNYVGNYLIAWRDRRHDVGLLKSHTIFWVTRGVMILVNPFIFTALMAVGMNFVWAQVVVLVTNTFINYGTSDKLVFRKANQAREEAHA